MAREFWIRDNLDNCIEYQETEDTIHVIEYSALEAAQVRIKELEEIVEEYKQYCEDFP